MLQGLEQDILDLLGRYLAVRSDPGTAGEARVEGFFRSYLAAEPYFLANPEHLGAFPVPADPLGRSISWALVRGSGPDTVVLIHHSDTVGPEDYQLLAGRLATWSATPRTAWARPMPWRSSTPASAT